MAAEETGKIDALQGKTGNAIPSPMSCRSATCDERRRYAQDRDQDIRFRRDARAYAGVLSAITYASGRQQHLQGVLGGARGGGKASRAPNRVINTKKVADIQGIQVNMLTHSWVEPNGYPGGGMHERAVLLKTRKAGDPNPFVDPATWNARAKRTFDNETKRLAEEKAKAGAK